MNKKREVWRMIKFTLFSISAGLIQEGTFLLFFNALKWDYSVAYLVSLVLSVLWNFTFNRRYTFRSDANIPRSMLLVALYYAVFTPLTTFSGKALVNAGWNENLVQILSMLLNFVTEFLYQKFVVYRKSIDTNNLANPKTGSTEDHN